MWKGVSCRILYMEVFFASSTYKNVLCFLYRTCISTSCVCVCVCVCVWMNYSDIQRKLSLRFILPRLDWLSGSSQNGLVKSDWCSHDLKASVSAIPLAEAHLSLTVVKFISLHSYLEPCPQNVIVCVCVYVSCVWVLWVYVCTYVCNVNVCACLCAYLPKKNRQEKVTERWRMTLKACERRSTHTLRCWNAAVNRSLYGHTNPTQQPVCSNLSADMQRILT